MKNKTALVIGSSGFIGKKISLRLESAGINVIKADIKDSPKFDVGQPTFINQFEKKPLDYIFHFGSPCSVLQFNENAVFCMENTLSGFKNAITLAKKTGAKLIYPSSGNIYGRLNPPHIESMYPQPTNLYGVAKLEVEHMVALSEIDAVGLRIFTGYGSGEEKKGNLASVVCLFLLDMLKGQRPIIWGDGKQIRDCVFIDDIVEVAIQSAERSVPSIINVGSGLAISYNEIIETINKVLQNSIEPIYKEKPQHFVEKALADNTLMKKNFGFTPITLEQGLSKFISHLHATKFA